MGRKGGWAEGLEAENISDGLDGMSSDGEDDEKNLL